MPKSEPLPPMDDADSWDVSLEVYAGHHHEAVGLASNFTLMKAYLTHKPPKITEALAALDAAIEVLYTHTDFPKASYALFLARIAQSTSKEDEDLIQSLGIEI
jgi:hypothetical protein